MRSLSMSGGNLLEKKSFKAVATAFTGMSKECMSTLPSIINNYIHFVDDKFSNQNISIKSIV